MIKIETCTFTKALITSASSAILLVSNEMVLFAWFPFLRWPVYGDIMAMLVAALFGRRHFTESIEVEQL